MSARSPEARIVAALLHLVRGISLADICIVLGGAKQGRIAEAVAAIRHIQEIGRVR